MFRVENTILSDEIATAKFACDLPKCKGGCCVVGDAGAPILEDEVTKIEKGWSLLKDELSREALKAVEENGLFEEGSDGRLRLQSTGKGEWVFASYSETNIAYCSLQKAFLNNRLDWEKPICCHLYPIRLKKVGEFIYANFTYLEDLCSAACSRGNDDEIFLSKFLKKTLVRRFGASWYQKFEEMCKEIRVKTGEAV